MSTSNNREEFVNEDDVNGKKEPLFIYRNNRVSKLNMELLKKYPGSYFYKEYMSDYITADGNVFIDYNGENDELIVKYMNDDESLIDDLRKMNDDERRRFINDLKFFDLPIKKEITGDFVHNEENKKIKTNQDNRTVMVNGWNAPELNIFLKKRHLFDQVFDNQPKENIKYFEEVDINYINLEMKYHDVIVDYLKNGKLNMRWIKKYQNNGNFDADELMNEMKMIGIKLSDEEVKEIRGCFDIRLLRGSTILLDTQYDDALREWLGSEHEWKMIYRASEHGYTAKSFHECCDNQRPTLIVIMSSGGWIFGGYTTQSWSVECIYNAVIYNQ